MERKTPYLGVISGVLLLVAVATPFIGPLVVSIAPPSPEQTSAQQNAEGWAGIGLVILAIFIIAALGLVAALIAVVSLVRREKYTLLPVLVILIGGGGSSYLLFMLLHH